MRFIIFSFFLGLSSSLALAHENSHEYDEFDEAAHGHETQSDSRSQTWWDEVTAPRVGVVLTVTALLAWRYPQVILRALPVLVPAVIYAPKVLCSLNQASGGGPCTCGHNG